MGRELWAVACGSVAWHDLHISEAYVKFGHPSPGGLWLRGVSCGVAESGEDRGPAMPRNCAAATIGRSKKEEEKEL